MARDHAARRSRDRRGRLKRNGPVPAERQRLAIKIREGAVSVGIGAAS